MRAPLARLAHLFSLLWSASLLSSAACGQVEDPLPDASVLPDAADSGETPPDSGAPDAGSLDVGVDVPDAGPPWSERVQVIFDAFEIAMHECPDRAWPGTAELYREASQVLLVSMSEQKAYLWNDLSDGEQDPPKIRIIDPSTISAEWYSFYNFGVFEGYATLGVSLDDTQALNDYVEMNGGELWWDYAVNLAFHEGFHLFVQPYWRIPRTGSRSSPYPLEAGERYARGELLRSLAAALEDVETSTLGAAAYWQERLRSEHGDALQRIHSIDVHEGSARFAEVMMQGLAEVGCDASEEELLDLLAERRPFYLSLPPGGHSSADAESYPLGAASGLLARSLGLSDWEMLVATSTTPVAALLRDEIAEPQPDDPEFLATVQAQVDATNAEIGALVQPLIDGLAMPADYYRFAIPGTWHAGAFGTDGFVQLVLEPGQPEVVLSMDATFFDPVDAVTIELADLTVMRRVPTPCPGIPPDYDYVMPIAKWDVTSSAGLYTVDTSTLTFTDLPATIVADTDGAEWLCPGN